MANLGETMFILYSGQDRLGVFYTAELAWAYAKAEFPGVRCYVKDVTNSMTIYSPPIS